MDRRRIYKPPEADGTLAGAIQDLDWLGQVERFCRGAAGADTVISGVR